MALEDFTRHQQGIIKRYYAQGGAVHLQRLGELVTDLYLATGKKREKLWQTLSAVMQRLEVPASRIEHLRQKDDPALVAKLVQELQAKPA